MAITTIILSKDRPAQLDLLLSSIERNGGGQFDVAVLASGGGYDDISQRAPVFAETDFQQQIEWMISAQASEFVCFMCDDGILYGQQPPPIFSYQVAFLAWPDSLLCFSLRTGQNTIFQYPTGMAQETPYPVMEGATGWTWQWKESMCDFGYPGSIDAHIFRTEDVRQMLTGKTFPNPTALECALVEGCDELAKERPLMACYPQSVYVGNPINRVSEQSGVRYGETYPVTAEECNRRFLAGERIDLDALDFSHVNGAHTEIELQWK